jgi:hypothetical protein
MTVILRRVVLSASVGGVDIPNLLAGRASFSFDSRVSQGTIVTATKPSISQDDELQIVMGVQLKVAGVWTDSHVVTRFVGLVRDFQYSYAPRGVATIARGYLTRAAEFENSDDPSFLGGMLIPDITGSTTGDTASNIVQAVLTLADVPFSGANIHSTSTLYGTVYDDAFLWRNGMNDSNPDLQEAGETALSYSERYDEIDAVFSSGAGGRYRTFETLGGVVYRYLVGGRPRGANDFTLTEGADILDAQFDRSTVETRNHFPVTGYDPGDGGGPEAYAPTPPTPKKSYRSSSPMIERSLDADPGDGMSCETVSNAVSLEYNREQVKGWITTFLDDEYGIAQTHLVTTLSGLPDRGGVAEPLWVQGLDDTVDEQGFTQRIGYLGGGVDSSLPAPP